MKCMQSCCVIVQWHQIKLAWWWKVLKNCEITDSHGTFCNWSNLPWRSTLSSKTHSPSLSIQSEVRQKPDNQSNMCFHPSFPTLRLHHTITTFSTKMWDAPSLLTISSQFVQPSSVILSTFPWICEIVWSPGTWGQVAQGLRLFAKGYRHRHISNNKMHSLHSKDIQNTHLLFSMVKNMKNNHFSSTKSYNTLYQNTVPVMLRDYTSNTKRNLSSRWMKLQTSSSVTCLQAKKKQPGVLNPSTGHPCLNG